MCVASNNPTQQCNPKESSVFSLRGNKRCIKGHDFGCEVKVLTVFGLDHWTRPKRKCCLLKQEWWAIQESSVQNLSTRLDKVIELDMDRARGSKVVDGDDSE